MNRTRDLAKRIAGLSPEKQALLTRRLRERHEISGLSEAVSRRPDLTFPLSFAQQRLWFLEQFAPNNPQYNIPAALRLTGLLNADAFRRSLNAVVQRHEVLRARFLSENGRPVQLVAPETNLRLPILDLRGMAKEVRRAEAIRIAAEEARRPFSLPEGPLIRAGLIRTAEDEHIFLLTMHHIVSDGWSTGILARELSSLYGAFTSGHRAELPDLPIQYADFAWWQRDRLQDSMERQLDFWKERLNGARTVLDLPTDRRRPPVETYRGECLWFDLPSSLAAGLDSLARSLNVTLFMLLLTAFRVLLYRYTGQEDVCIGTPVANRARPEVQGLIGFFVNTLVMRNAIVGDPPFAELLREERKAALDAYSHQDVPFEMLIETLRPERNLSYSPLFQVMFALQEDPVKAIQLPGLQCELLEIDRGTAKFDLTLFMESGPTGLRGAFEYNRDLFDPQTIRQMASCLRVLLQSIVSDPDQSVGALSLLTEETRKALVGERSGARKDYPRHETIDRLFETQARQTPDSIAVVFGDQQVTYRELNDRADRLAESLRSLGTGPEAAVGIFVDRSVEMIVAHLGILKAGAAYLPLEPAWPPERLRYMLEEANVPVLLTQEKHRALVSDSLPFASAALAEPAEQPGPVRPAVICLDSREGVVRKGSNPALADGRAEGLAYVMYTSGSTGVPKGVRVVHRGVVRLVKNTNFAALGPDQVFLQLAPISFDAATLEIWAPLLNGGKLVVLQPGSPSLAEIGNAIQRHGITTLWLTSSLFHMMVDERLEDLRGLGQLLAGGDVLSVAHVQRVLDRLPAVRMINGYGPTENTTFSSCYQASGREDGSVPIGRPVANTRIHILDRNMQPVPPGVTGELFAAGDGLGRDYLNQAGLTAERFIPNPFPVDQDGGERLYRTGDLARYRRDGNIEFLGRMDSQVKIRGFRIEPQEIESVLARHPHVKEAAVLAVEDSPGDKRLVAFVVPRQAPGPGTGDMRKFAKQKLPEYMVPASFVMLDALPLTPSGKVDRRALPIPDRHRPDAGTTFAAPRNPTEEILAKIWTEVLRIRTVGISDDFFELGGHSLVATQIVSRIRDAFQVELPVRDLFQTPTVAGLAERLDTLRWAVQGLHHPGNAASGEREAGEL